MLQQLTTALFITVLAIGCGEGKNDKKQDKQEDNLTAEQQADKERLAADLPKSTIMVVELDKDGNEIPETAQLRTVDELVEGKSNDELIAMFEAGEAPKNIIEDESAISDDLNETSTQSWWGWRRRCAQRYCYNNYRPRCYYGGYNYGYNQVNVGVGVDVNVNGGYGGGYGNPPGPVGGPGAGYGNPPGPIGGPGAGYPTPYYGQVGGGYYGGFQSGYRTGWGAQQYGNYCGGMPGGQCGYNVYGWQRTYL